MVVNTEIRVKVGRTGARRTDCERRDVSPPVLSSKSRSRYASTLVRPVSFFFLGGTTDDADLKQTARQALLAARKKADDKREQKVIQAALLLISGPKKKN